MDGTNAKGIVSHIGEFHMKAVYQIVFCAGTKTISDRASVTHKNGDFRRDFCKGAKLRRVNFESGKSHTGY